MDMLKDQAYQQLLAMIWSGRLEHDVIYSLNEVAKELDISRTPVRDAVHRLHDEKRLDLLPSRGFRLHRMTAEEFRQLHHFTVAIEGYCIVSLVEERRAAPESPRVMALADSVSAMARSDLDRLSFKAFYDMDNGFHLALINSVGDHFVDFLSQYHLGFVNRPEIHISSLPLDRRAVLDFHRRILDAVLGGDAQGGYRAVREHAEYILEHYLTENDA